MRRGENDTEECIVCFEDIRGIVPHRCTRCTCTLCRSCLDSVIRADSWRHRRKDLHTTGIRPGNYVLEATFACPQCREITCMSDIVARYTLDIDHEDVSQHVPAWLREECLRGYDVVVMAHGLGSACTAHALVGIRSPLSQSGRTVGARDQWVAVLTALPEGAVVFVGRVDPLSATPVNAPAASWRRPSTELLVKRSGGSVYRAYGPEVALQTELSYRFLGTRPSRALLFWEISAFGEHLQMMANAKRATLMALDRSAKV